MNKVESNLKKLGFEATAMTMDEIFALRRSFQPLIRYSGNRFAAFVSKNINTLDGKIKSMNKAMDALIPRGEKMDAYLKAEQELFTEFTRKDEKGNPIVQNGKHDIPDEMSEEFSNRLEELRKEHAEAWKMVKDFEKAREEYLKSETEIVIHRIMSSEIPDQVTGEHRIPIEEFIVDDI